MSSTAKVQGTTRKELLKLSKTKLIKICKKNKLAINGTKLDMIEKILSFQNNNKTKLSSNTSLKRKSRKKNKKKKIIEHSASNTCCNASKIDILVEGYMNEYRNKHYAHSLIIILVQYIGNIFFKFDICPTKYIADILKNGTVIKRAIYQCEIDGDDWDNPHNIKLYHHHQYIPHEIVPAVTIQDDDSINAFDVIVYGASFPFNSNIHKLSIQIKNTKTFDRVGIISDIDLCKKNCRMMDIACNAYYIYPIDNAYIICCKLLSKDKVRKQYVKWGSNQGFACKVTDKFQYISPKISDFGVNENKIRKLVNKKGWMKNDIVTLIIDCNEWKLKFIVNGKGIGEPINIQKHSSYYAAIGSITNSIKFAVV